MNKFTLALAALSVAVTAVAQTDAKDEPTGYALKPAVSELTDGGHYYIYDSHAGRYSFLRDMNPDALVRITGNHTLNSAAYGKLTEANYIWTAAKTDDGNWQFKNVATGHYIGSANNAADAPADMQLSAFPNTSEGNIFSVKCTDNDKCWDADYANGATTTSLSYWSAPGHPIMFYTAVADGDSWNFDAVPAWTVKVTYTYEGITVGGPYTVQRGEGETYSFTAPRYYEGEAFAGVIDGHNIDKVIECTGYKFPFIISESIDDAKYQALYIHSNWQNIHFTYNPDTEAVVGSQTTRWDVNTEAFTDNDMFAIVGNLTDGFKVYSKAAGKYLLKNGDNTTLTDNADEATAWMLTPSAAETAEKYFCLKADNNYLNIQNNQLKYWVQADQGSSIWSVGVAQPEINAYLTVFNAAATIAAANEDEEKLDLANKAIATVNALNPYDAIPETTRDDLDATKEQLELIVAIAHAKADLRKYFDASYTGKVNGANVAMQLDWCATVEEVEITYNDLVEAAMLWMQSDMESGFVPQNKRTGYYLGATVTNDTTETGVNTTVTFNAKDSITLNEYWKAEFTDNGNSVKAPARTFYLHNVKTGHYLGVQEKSSEAVPAVATVEEAALFSVVAGTEGFELLLNAIDPDSVAIANNFLNTNTLLGTQPVVYQYPNDGGAFWIAAQLPSFSEAQVAVDFVGETVGTDGYSDYTSVRAVQIKVPAGSVTTGLGNLRVYIRTQDGDFDLLNIPVADAVAGQTPVQGVIETTAFNPPDFLPETITTNVDIYTINLNPERTEPAEYRIDLDAAAFELTSGENGTLWTPAAYNSVTITEAPGAFVINVTPAAGKVTDLVNITLDAADGFAANWAYSGTDGITLKKGDETLLTILIGQISDYDSFDMEKGVGPYYTIPVNQTVPGTYVFTIPAGFFENDKTDLNEETTVTWTIDEQDGINTVTNATVNGRVVYDLQGRRVANPGRGLYIVNGNKTILR